MAAGGKTTPAASPAGRGRKKTIDWMNVVGGAAVIRLCDSDSEQTPCHLESNHEEGLVGWESAAQGGHDLRRPPPPVVAVRQG